MQASGSSYRYPLADQEAHESDPGYRVPGETDAVRDTHVPASTRPIFRWGPMLVGRTPPAVPRNVLLPNRRQPANIVRVTPSPREGFAQSPLVVPTLPSGASPGLRQPDPLVPG